MKVANISCKAGGSMPESTVQSMNIYYEINGEQPKTITIIHGLGANHRAFATIKEYPQFHDYRLLFIDLPGFGQSDKPEPFDYAMSTQAEVVIRLLDGLGIRETALIGHSMGGIIGQMIAERFPVTQLINCEGNLILEDCKLSAQIAAGGLRQFEAAGFNELKNQAARTPFYEGYCQTTAYAMYQSAWQLVDACRNGNLLERYVKLPISKLYVYGGRTKGKRKSEQLLIQNGMALKYIPASGHNMMIENPADFYRIAADFL
jgi:pimeloyl-ACP methyl ester carboxylesterase